METSAPAAEEIILPRSLKPFPKVSLHALNEISSRYLSSILTPDRRLLPGKLPTKTRKALPNSKEALH